MRASSRTSIAHQITILAEANTHIHYIDSRAIRLVSHANQVLDVVI